MYICLLRATIVRHHQAHEAEAIHEIWSRRRPAWEGGLDSNLPP
jgi:hypothetical protein